jgi:flagellar biosynthesis GTPase FlhF
MNTRSISARLLEYAPAAAVGATAGLIVNGMFVNAAASNPLVALLMGGIGGALFQENLNIHENLNNLDKAPISQESVKRKKISHHKPPILEFQQRKKPQPVAFGLGSLKSDESTPTLTYLEILQREKNQKVEQIRAKEIQRQTQKEQQKIKAKEQSLAQREQEKAGRVAALEKQAESKRLWDEQRAERIRVQRVRETAYALAKLQQSINPEPSSVPDFRL